MLVVNISREPKSIEYKQVRASFTLPPHYQFGVYISCHSLISELIVPFVWDPSHTPCPQHSLSLFPQAHTSQPPLDTPGDEEGLFLCLYCFT